MKFISAGESGVWAAAKTEDKIYYRMGTFGDTPGQGLGWMALPGTLRVSRLCSGLDRVLAMSPLQEVFEREEMFGGNPFGIFWSRLMGVELSEMDCYQNDVWGVRGGQVYFNTLGTLTQLSSIAKAGVATPKLFRFS